MDAKSYDLVVVGTGSAMNLMEPYLTEHPQAKVAVIEKDKPGGICLTRGCIPTKLLTHPADVVRTIEGAGEFGIEVAIKKVDFRRVMKRMHDHVDPEIESIRKGLSSSPNIDYYAKPARFVAPYTLEIDGTRIESGQILLCAGSKPQIPDIPGLDTVPYHTTDTILDLEELPQEIAIMGGGYIAAELGHFFSSMGSRVTIIGRNQRFLPREDPEISSAALAMVGRHLEIRVGTAVERVARDGQDITLFARNGKGKTARMRTRLLLVATGRASNSDVLQPEKGGIRTNPDGWIEVDEHFRTSQPGIWAFGDCLGRYQYKHTANYESILVYYNAFRGEKRTPDYHAVPHATFTHPEIAAVGMTEPEALKAVGPDRLLVGRYFYRDCAKGEAIGATDEFVKVLADSKERRILGAHIIGPQASVLIQGVINVMYAPGQHLDVMVDAMHIHPALPEVVERAFGALAPVGGHTHHPA